MVSLQNACELITPRHSRLVKVFPCVDSTCLSTHFKEATDIINITSNTEYVETLLFVFFIVQGCTHKVPAVWNRLRVVSLPRAPDSRLQSSYSSVFEANQMD